MAPVESVRLLPSEPGLAQDVLDYVSRVGGSILSEGEENPSLPSEWVWRLSNGVELHYIEDSVFNAKYVVFAGDGARLVADDFRRGVPCWDLEQITIRWDDSFPEGRPEELIDLVTALGLLASPFPTPELTKRFELAVQHTDPGVRFAAALAAGATAWPELLEFLRAQQRHELHPRVQHALDVAVAGR